MKTTHRNAFTLIEILVAMGIFFLCIFSILELTSQSLRGARSIQMGAPTAGMLAAEFTGRTNRVEEGSESGDFGEAFPDFQWQREVALIGTNGLYRVDFWIYRSDQNSSPDPNLSVLLHRPDSVLGPGGGRTRNTR